MISRPDWETRVMLMAAVKRYLIASEAYEKFPSDLHFRRAVEARDSLDMAAKVHSEVLGNLVK